MRAEIESVLTFGLGRGDICMQDKKMMIAETSNRTWFYYIEK